MKVADILRFARERGEPVFSFEFFPPKTDEGERQLFATVEALRPLGPAFVSVTYGAGGSTRARTVELVTRLKRETEVEAVAHVTCAGSSRTEIAGVLDEVAAAGVQNVLALRCRRRQKHPSRRSRRAPPARAPAPVAPAIGAGMIPRPAAIAPEDDVTTFACSVSMCQ